MSDTTVICKNCGTRWEYGTAETCAHCGGETAYMEGTGIQVYPAAKPAKGDK